MKNLFFRILILLLTFFYGCGITPKSTFYKNFSLTAQNIISVDQFNSSQDKVAGEYIRDLLIKELLSRNFTVKEINSEDVEYVIAGNVTRFLPEKKFLVYRGENKQQILLSSTLTEISGSNVYNIGSAFGLPDSQIVVTNATVGVSARLVEKKTGNIVWSGSFVYEALTVDTAAEVVANYLITSLTKIKK